MQIQSEKVILKGGKERKTSKKNYIKNILLRFVKVALKSYVILWKKVKNKYRKKNSLKQHNPI